MDRFRNARILFALSPLALALAGGVPAGAEDVPDGQALFLAHKCRTCHAVSEAGIEAKSEKIKGPDLGTVAPREEEWLMAFLKKQERLDGKPHKKAFKGTDGELATLVAWLRSVADAP